jgi:hypothetical protein
MHVIAHVLKSVAAVLLAFATLALPPFVPLVSAAASAGCEGGGFVITGLNDGRPINTDGDTIIPASNVGARFLVAGKYVAFTVVAASLGVENWTLTGAPNPLDITGNRRTAVFASKTPDHQGLTLTGDVLVERSQGDIVIERSGNGVDMKIQAKDCANGGVFQMEVERGDGGITRFTHILAEDVFYFDNPNFRAAEGDVVPFKDTTVTVTARINFANGFSAKFVGRDSPQVAQRVLPPALSCVNQIRKRDGSTVIVRHCGRISQWDVSSGGRMGQVMGEDATEVAPPATNCVKNCQAQNRVRGRSVVLGFPFPVPDTSRLTPPFP